MDQLEMQLRLSVIRVELERLALTLEPKAAKVVTYAVRILGLVGEGRR